MSTELTKVEELKKNLFANQYKPLISYMGGDEQKAIKFLGAVAWCYQSVPKLSECTQESVLNAFMKMAELDLYPSNVSGQAYVIPYGKVANFQLWYQGLVTLFYRSGAKAIRSEIVRQIDVDQWRFSYENGIIRHSPDIFNPKRKDSPAVGAYVIVDLPTGGAVAKAMGKEEIIGIGKKFSKAYAFSDSPWKESNDPELWMWKKTVLKQVAKLVPKNERLISAIEADNSGDTDFEEISHDSMKTRALRPSEANVTGLLDNLPTNTEPPAPPAPEKTPEKEAVKEPEKPTVETPTNTPTQQTLPAEEWTTK